jgi:hypothetical protein
MDEPIRLKTMQFQFSEDRQLVRVCFWDDAENGTAILLKAEEMRGITAEFVRVTMSLQIDGALAPDPDATPTPAQSLPATESALLVAKTAKLVRWKKGGAVLQATTAEGVTVHLAMRPELQQGLLRTLSAELPAE